MPKKPSKINLACPQGMRATHVMVSKTITDGPTVDNLIVIQEKEHGIIAIISEML